MQTFQRRYKAKRSLRLCQTLLVVEQTLVPNDLVEQTLVPNDLDSRGYSTKFDGASRVINPGDWIILEGKRIYGCERELFDNLWIGLDVPRRG